jgi:hypothetical protein
VRNQWRVALACAVAYIGLGGATSGVAALHALAPGQWQLREAGGSVRSLCLGDASQLLQLRHGSAACKITVLDDSPARTTVHYSCAGAGFGRTTVTVETPRLVHVDTQGVAEGEPFVLDYEGRHTGACPRAR